MFPSTNIIISFVMVAWRRSLQGETCSHALEKMNVVEFDRMMKDRFDSFLNTVMCPLQTLGFAVFLYDSNTNKMQTS